MKTLLATLTLGTLTLFAPASAVAGDCHDRYSTYRGHYVQRSYIPQVRYYYPSYSYSAPRYVDRHHSCEQPRFDSHGHRIDSHGHHVDSRGRHYR